MERKAEFVGCVVGPAGRVGRYLGIWYVYLIDSSLVVKLGQTLLANAVSTHTHPSPRRPVGTVVPSNERPTRIAARCNGG